MTFGRLDCWKKQKFTHEIVTKKTKNNTHRIVEKHKIAHQKTKKSHTMLQKKL
jgi:hypothetical protein